MAVSANWKQLQSEMASKRRKVEDEEPKTSKRKINPEDAKTSSLVKEKSFKGVTRVLGVDCEMVGIGYGGKESVLARVSVVNHFGNVLYDAFVTPRESVTDYRTAVSGIRKADLDAKGKPFKDVQAEVAELFKGRVLVGHAIKHDLKVLFLEHPRKMIRDTSIYKPFRDAFGGRTPSLKRLSERMLGVQIQDGEHSSVQDAQAAVRLYTMFRNEWEKSIEEKRKFHPNNRLKKKAKTKVVETATKSDQYVDSD